MIMNKLYEEIESLYNAFFLFYAFILLLSSIKEKPEFEIPRFREMLGL